MNKTEFSNLLANPSKLTEDHNSSLDSILIEFPYFQAARSLYLKGLKNQESFKYNKALKTTAAYTCDRSILFDFITSIAFMQNTISEQIKHNNESLKSIVVTEFDHLSAADSFKMVDIDLENQLEEEEELLKIGKPLNFKKGETYSFSQWLQLTKISPINRSKSAEKSTPSQEKNLNLIDAFIAKSPKIKASKNKGTLKDLSEKTILQSDALMTETLARIYLEQKNFNKALQSFKILSLKYPEKSGLFADQIKAIKKLLEKNNI